MPIFTRMYKLG